MKSAYTGMLIVFMVLALMSGCTDPAVQSTPSASTAPAEATMDPVSVVFCPGMWTTNSNAYTAEAKGITTQLFTVATLPVGSKIILGTDYECKAVVWTNYQSREGAESIEDLTQQAADGTKYVEIPQDWWSKYESCGFNISVVSGSSKTPEDAMNEVQILAPIGKAHQFNYDWNDDGVLKILTVGNSFSDDMMEHVYEIAKNVGVADVQLGNLYYGACRVRQHYDFWTNNKAVYEYRSNNNGRWTTWNNSTFEKAFETTDWDYICFQESAQEIQSNPKLYEHLPALIRMAKDRCPNAKIIWHMPWANPHNNYMNLIDVMYRDLCAAARTQIEPLVDMQLVIPCGTAIQNMRTSYANSQGLLLRDGWHLSQDVGRYIAGLTVVRVLTGLSIDNVTWIPAGRAHDIAHICIEAANNAALHPYSVTQSLYTEAPEGWRNPM